MPELDIDLGGRIGLIGDVHGNGPFLADAIRTLAKSGCTHLVQLGDFGMVWQGGPWATKDMQRLGSIERVLAETGTQLWVVLGNHENYDVIGVQNTDENGIWWPTTRIGILPRAGRMRAAGRPVGFLAGAASIDAPRRTPGRSWWEQEIPTDEQAAGIDGDEDLEVVFAHDAMWLPKLQARLARTRHMWHPRGLAYAEKETQRFTERVRPAIADRGLVLSGHYHFTHEETTVIDRADGSGVKAVRNIILNAEYATGSIGILTMPTTDDRVPEVDLLEAQKECR